MPAESNRLTLRKLFTEFSKTEIPIIQRDYAQGRPDSKEVRSGILASLHETLTKPTDDPSLPLDLDFIYGSINKHPDLAESSFLPLDGQQRLTTLFLLHWCTAWLDGASDAFKSAFCINDKSKLSYLVRPSSEEFFDELAHYIPDNTQLKELSLSELIEEQPWFFLSWKHDPTIQSALNMLDDMHEQFADSSGCFAKLMEEGKPYITFQFLDVQQHGFSDDLYIKMNARGKPLTVFENFKARLEQHLKTAFGDWQEELNGKMVPINDYFSHRIEAEWSDLFWHYRDENTKLFDAKVMNLLRDLVTVTRPTDDESAEDRWKKLRDTSVPLTFHRLTQLQSNDKAAYQELFSVLDKLSGNEDGVKTYLTRTTHFDESALFTKSINGKPSLTYDELLQLRAYSGYLQQHREIDSEKFTEWMRVISNLARNTIFNRFDEFLSALKSLNNLLPKADDILSHLAGEQLETPGFNQPQLKEERLKAQLMIKSDDWRNLILESESHGYFAGQIGFLLKFCGVQDTWDELGSVSFPDADDQLFRDEFKEYWNKAKQVFDDHGLVNFDTFIWERALLAQGDYLSPSGRNFSFLTNERRDASWKRLLRGDLKEDPDGKRRLMVKTLLDKLPASAQISESLRQIIADAALPEADWRSPLVEDPRLIGYCAKRMIRYLETDDSLSIYLLGTTQRNGRHVELFSYHLFKNEIEKAAEEGRFAPFNKCEYVTAYETSVEPHIGLRCDVLDLILEIQNAPQKKLGFIIYAHPSSETELSPAIDQKLTDWDFVTSPAIEGQPVKRFKSIPREEVLSLITNLATSLNNSLEETLKS